MGYGVFVQKNPGIITLFGATKPLETEVFFAIDEGVLWRKATHELAVDHGVSASELRSAFSTQTSKVSWLMGPPKVKATTRPSTNRTPPRGCSVSSV